MSAYTPSMAGKVDQTEAKALSFSQASCEGELPAILRLSPADKYHKTPGSLKVQMQAACLPAEGEPTKTSVGLKINMQPANVSAAPMQVKEGYIANAAAVADPELLQHIPRLKETLQALDSEMHANASSEVEKRLQMHERILQLQGQQLNKAQQVVEQTAKAFGQILSTQALHTKLHSATGKRLLTAEENLGKLEGVCDLHGQLHQASGAGLVSLNSNVSELDEKVALHSDLHHASGKRVLDLQDTVDALGERNELHTQVHKCSGENIKTLQSSLRKVDEKLSDLSSISSVHTQLHKESNKFMTNKLDAEVGGDFSVASQEELRKLRVDLDALALENAELKRSVSKHGLLHAKTASIVARLGIENEDATVKVQSLGVCTCTPNQKCTNCIATEAHVGHTRQHHRHGMHGHGEHMEHGTVGVGAAKAATTLHSQLLTHLESDIASSNKPGKKRR